MSISTNLSKNVRKERNELRNSKINSNIKNIKEYEKHLLELTRKADMINYEQLKTSLSVTTSATEQLKRDGKPFTKKDLIAIICAINSNKIGGDISCLESLTAPDLTAMIRCIIYDINRTESSIVRCTNESSIGRCRNSTLLLSDNNEIVETKPKKLTKTKKCTDLVIKEN